MTSTGNVTVPHWNKDRNKLVPVNVSGEDRGEPCHVNSG